jgi:hypothetical protein
MINDMTSTGNPPDVEADAKAVYEAVAAGRPVDPEIARRVRERADAISEEIFRKHGVLKVAVDLIREIREEE